MAVGRELRYTISGDSRSLVAASAAGERSIDKLGASASRSTSKAAQFSDTLGKVSTTLARSASSFGLPVAALRALDDAADVAELGFKNLTTATAGFTVASVGVAGAGLAIGTALGTALRWVGDLNNGLGMLGLSTRGLDADMKRLYQTMFGGEMVAKGFDKETQGRFADIAANTAGRAEAAALERVRLMQRGGMTAGQIREQLGVDAGKERTSATEVFLRQLETQEKAAAAAADRHRQALEEAERQAQRWRDAWVKAAEEARAEFEKFRADFAASTEEAARDVSKVLGARAAERADVGVKEFVERTGLGSDELAGPPTDMIVQAKDATLDWSQALGDVAHGFAVLGISANSVLGRIIGAATAAGASLDRIIKGGKGLLGGLSVGLGVFGVAASAFSLVKGLFGGPSKEEIAAQRAQAEAERKEREAEAARRREAARQMRAEGIAGLVESGPAFFAAHRPAPGTVLSEDDARHQGTLFAAAWGEVVKEKGIAAAADAFGAAFRNMKADFETAGLELPAWMKAIGGQLALGEDPGFRNVAQGAQTSAAFLRAFGQSGGGVTPDVRAAFEQEARAAFAGGKSIAEGLGQGAEDATKAGFAAANPILRELLNESVVSGTTLSADIQEMIRVAGIVPDVEFQQLSELRAIRAAVAGSGGGGGGGGGQAGGHVTDDIYHRIPKDIPKDRRAASGKRIEKDTAGRGTVILAGEREGETIVPDSQAGDWARAVLGGSSNAGSVAAATSAIAEEVARRTRQVTVPLTLNVATDVSQLPRHRQEEFLDQQRKQIIRVIRGEGRREIEFIVDSILAKKGRR